MVSCGGMAKRRSLPASFKSCSSPGCDGSLWGAANGILLTIPAGRDASGSSVRAGEVGETEPAITDDGSGRRTKGGATRCSRKDGHAVGIDKQWTNGHPSLL